MKTSRKNIGPFLAFTDGWFAKNQSALLLLVNNPLTKRLFRWILRINRDDISLDQPITELYSNRFSFGDKLIKKKGKWYLERTTDFRTHPKFGKRIYHAFRPIWWVIHFWDWSIADRFIPKLSYGFATLTAYPDAGDPGTTTIDGVVQRSGVNETFGTIRGGAGTLATNATDFLFTAQLDATGTTNQYGRLRRSIALFDTSSLTTSASISSATIGAYGWSKTNALGSADWHVGSATPASNTTLAASDYGNCGTISFGSIAYASFSTSGYNDITLDSNGLGNISKTGVSKFSFQLSWDINNSFTGSWANSAISNFDNYSADQAGTTNDPKLVVTYTTSTNYPITAAYGTYTLTGQASLFHLGRKLVAAYGSFVLTGQTAIVKSARKITAAFGSFVYTGYNAGLLFGKILTAAFGSFTLTGQTSILTSTRKLVAEVGSFVWTGFAASLRIGYGILAAMGTYVLSGQNTSVTAQRLMTAAYATFTFTGYAASFVKNLVVTATVGLYTITGVTARLLVNNLSTAWSKLSRSSDPTWTKQNKSDDPTWTKQNRS